MSQLTIGVRAAREQAVRRSCEQQMSSATVSRLVYPLAAPAGPAPAEFGSKALNLARLASAGLPVPPGFCITASAYAEHVDAEPLAQSVSATLAAIRGGQAGDRRALLAKQRQDIAAAPASSALREQVEAACRELQPGRLAVRSSATMEDLADRSFAGLYDTFLGVSDVPGVVSAVKNCWASLWTERAFDYREQNGFDHRAARMAVVVQTMVEADISGVLFTADPVSGTTDRLIIEAAFGLGEGLVSGKVTPDRTVLARQDLHVLEQVVAEKVVEIVVGENSTTEHAVEPERAKAACLSGDAAQRLGELGLKSETVFGTPQDVEWAIADGKIFILQSRPITTLAKPRSFEERQIWSNLNAGEVMPDVVTPMTWSFIAPLIEGIFESLLDPLGMNVRGNPVVGLVAGRAYFNLNTFVGIMQKAPGYRTQDPAVMFGGKAGTGPHVPPEDVPEFDFRWSKFLLRFPSLLAWFLAHSTRRGLQFAITMRQKTQSLASGETSFSEAVLFQKLEDWMQEIARTIPDALAFAGSGTMYMTQLFTTCRKWLGDSDGSLANGLLAGLGNMDSAEAGLAQWRLATLAHSHAGVEQALLGDDDFNQLRRTLPSTAGGTEFLAAWDNFMDEYGHHARGEVEFANARWRETPDAVRSLICGYLRALGTIDPIAAQRDRSIERERLTGDCRRRLRNPVKRLLFNLLLRNAQRGCVVRENVKSEAVRSIALGRDLMRELGERLHRRGLLERGDDVFFLRYPELGPLVQGQADFDVRQTVASRKAEYQRNLTLNPPQVVVGKFDPARFVPDEFDADAKVLTGVAVSPGVATGPARVILHCDAGEHVLPGEILVAPFTDPGWTPYFLRAAAIVMDQGGLLSHGSIIAREYGIPAVVNVGPATRIVRTGQKIHVDGGRGRVTIVGE
jgi:pyruvate,water dikinase